MKVLSTTLGTILTIGGIVAALGNGSVFAQVKPHHVRAHKPHRAEPIRPVHPPKVVHRITVMHREEAKGPVRPHLHEAMESLIAAQQTLQTTGSGEAALGQLRTAFAELNASAPADVYHSHRYDAIQATRHAIKLLKENQPTPQIASLNDEAIGHVQYCLSAPTK